MQRLGRFDANVGPQCQLKNCCRGFLSSIKYWSAGINLPATLLKKISLPLEEVHSVLE